MHTPVVEKYKILVNSATLLLSTSLLVFFHITVPWVSVSLSEAVVYFYRYVLEYLSPKTRLLWKIKPPHITFEALVIFVGNVKYDYVHGCFFIIFCLYQLSVTMSK